MVQEQDILHFELRERIQWLIRLRWIAIAGVFITITGGRYLLHMDLALLPLYLGNGLLLIYNFVFYLYDRARHHAHQVTYGYQKAAFLANLQIALDLFLLSWFIHFVGGIENPLIFYFVFHMVIASILLSRRAANWQASGAILYLGFVVFGECFGWLPHYHIQPFLPENQCLVSLHFVSGVFVLFASTLYLTVYMTTSIVNKLHVKELELSEANRKLSEKDRLKSQYVLTVSHDIQSSLATIQTCLSVVLDNLAGNISDKAREFVNRAEQRTTYMLQFVKDLLDLSKMRTLEKLEKQSVSLHDLAEKVVDQYQSTIEEKELTLVTQFDSALQAQVNSRAMEEVFANLLGNAIKYTPNGGKIDWKISKNNGWIESAISDTGIGISPEDKSKIFNDFFRARNAEILDKNGTGLGLAIVRHIVEAHQGKIWVESQLGQGSEFIVQLPVTILQEA